MTNSFNQSSITEPRSKRDNCSNSYYRSAVGLSGFRLAWCVFALMSLFRCATHGGTVSSLIVYTGAYDGSAAVAIDTNRFVAASDEDSTLRIYRRDTGGKPLQQINLSSFLEVDPHSPETDIEAAARIGNRVFWISSHGRNKNGKEKTSRHRFFATDIVTTEHGVQFLPVGKPYEDLLADMIAAAQLKTLDLEDAAGRLPKNPGGLSIEGLASTPDNHLLIGFRNPVSQGRALLVPLLNPDEVIEGKHARFGAPIQLNLTGLGIRDIASWQGEYIISAGPPEGGGPFRLFRWSGGDSLPKQIKHVSLKGLHPEAVVIYPDKGLREFQLLSDDSTKQKITTGKAPSMLVKKQFRSVWVTP